MEEERNNFLEGVSAYYKMKTEYEEANFQLRRKIIKNKELSWKEKRSEYKKLKPKCVNCKRPVGTIFSNVYNPEENGRKLMAVCGDRSHPCPLNILINLGETITYVNDSSVLEKEIILLKNRIIKEKNDLIFGYISSEDAVKSFEDIKDILNLTLSNYELNLEKYMDIVDSKYKNDSIRKEKIAIYQDIQNIKDYVSRYNGTENVQFIRDAVTLYITQLIPKIDKINKLEFPYRVVVYDSDEDTHHFIQKKYTIDELETNYSKHKVGIEDFQVGTKERKNAQRQRQVRAKEQKTQKKELKKQEFVIDSEEDEVEVEVEDRESESDGEDNNISLDKTDNDNDNDNDNDVNFEDENGETYLFKAAKMGNIEKVQEQIENGANVHKKTIRGETPLYGAVTSGNSSIVKYLLDNGADADINVAANWGFTPLREATNKNYLEIIDLLKNKGGILPLLKVVPK